MTLISVYKFHETRKFSVKVETKSSVNETFLSIYHYKINERAIVGCSTPQDLPLSTQKLRSLSGKNSLPKVSQRNEWLDTLKTMCLGIWNFQRDKNGDDFFLTKLSFIRAQLMGCNLPFWCLSSLLNALDSVGEDLYTFQEDLSSLGRLSRVT